MSRSVRRRTLSADERRLWSEVVRAVRPLPGRPEPAPDTPPAPVPPTVEPPSVPPTTTAPRPRLQTPPPLAPALDRRAARALARGRTGADATLDLHGLTQGEAHARLTAFLRRAQASGQSLVLVITGRGSSTAGPGERGVLRRMVPLWLGLPELRPLVIGFEQAGARQGGAGALYVRLRRNRAH